MISKTTENELNQLQKFADAMHCKVYTNQSDLDPKDKVMDEMRDWCKKQQDIVVLSNGTILSCSPTSRSVQNCKIVMMNKGLKLGVVAPASKELITQLLTHQNTKSIEIRVVNKAVTEQQQRLRLLVREALLAKASDIHIEVREDVARIRFRKYGELILHAEWLPKLAHEIASIAFNKEIDQGISHFNSLLPQENLLSLVIDHQNISLRVASLPAYQGFDVVIRIFSPGTDDVLSLNQLGYDDNQIEILTRGARSKQGIILIAGPSGSAKTTTVAACMQFIPPHRKIYTIEESVEKVISSATQIPLHTENKNHNFSTIGFAALRMDPDVIFLGEIRDKATARAMIHSATIGHLVFSTIQCTSAVGIINLLVELRISPWLLADRNLLVCLVYQRLIPILCEQCCQPLNKSELHKPFIKRWQSVFTRAISQVRVRGVGCKTCNNSGLSGRKVIADIIWMDDKCRDFIHRIDMLGLEKYMRKQGWISHYEQAIDMIRKGRCDPLDMEKVIGDIYKRELI